MKKLIIGNFNGSNEIFYWDIAGITEESVDIGDYAAVENKNGYDLVKIIGKAVVEDDFKYGHRRVLFILKKEKLQNRLKEMAAFEECPF